MRMSLLAIGVVVGVGLAGCGSSNMPSADSSDPFAASTREVSFDTEGTTELPPVSGHPRFGVNGCDLTGCGVVRSRPD
jgi:hypothetical protein